MSERKITKIKSKTRWGFFHIVLLLGLLVYAVCLFAPLIWAVITAFKQQSEFRINIIGLPKTWTWNFSYIFSKFFVNVSSEDGVQKVGMANMFLNSFLYAGGCAFFATLIPFITSYLCARFRYKFSKVIYTVVIITMVLPIIGNLPAEIRMARTLGLFNHIWGLWLMKANFLGIYFLVFYGMFRTMPMAYTEAAKIDGAGNLRILSQIIFPMSKHTFLTVMLINFITFWNDYQTPLVYIPSHPTIAIGMYQMAYTNVNTLSTVPMRMSAAILMLIPILALFMCFHKRLLGNLTVGGIKG